MDILCHAEERLSMRSTDYTEAHFDAKAGRYQAALSLAPYARTFELLPFLMFLNDRLARRPKDETAADLLCGSGFLTSAIRGCFARVVGIDVSGGMLSRYPVAPDTVAIKSALDQHSSLLVDDIEPAAIVALAGLHHVYETANGQVDRLGSDDLQVDAVLDWVSALPSGGVAVLADITDPALPAEFSTDVAMLSTRHVDLTRRYLSLSDSLQKSVVSASPGFESVPKSPQDYVQRVFAYSPHSVLPSPGRWFRHVVAEHGLYGHNDHFLNGDELVGRIRAAGFDISFHELPTPWVFSSQETFVSFFYDKFAFGPPVESIDAIPARIRRLISTQAERFLGIRRLPHGSVSIGWRLGFYVVVRN